MASIREQILQAVLVKLEAVLVDLSWQTAIRNPRDPLGEDQINAIVMMDGGGAEPQGLSGYVDEREVEFSVGILVAETQAATAEELLDAGYVAIVDKLIDPADIQIGGLAVGIRQGAEGDPVFGRPEGGARILGAMAMDFSVRYMVLEGAASTPGP